MNIHEYQAKQLFAVARIPVAKGQVAHSVAAAEKVADSLGGEAWVVKAQVHSGGRGEAGGVRRVEGKAELDRYVSELMSRPLVTRQSGEPGLPVKAVLIEELCDYERELYLSILVDREREGWMILASPEGGMDIESEAGRAKLMQCHIDAVAGLRSHHIRALIKHLQLDKPLHKPFAQLLDNLLGLFKERDLSLVEINPLVITRGQGLLALDAKINIDDNALYRQPKILAYRDASQEDERESIARECGLNYISLDGEIGCMVNGAGLAMATMDLIQLYGGRPANFLDVGGTATVERVSKAFSLILSDNQVKAILVNIFGGIVRCDVIAEGIVQAIQDVHVGVPVVVRLEGTNAEQGKAILDQSSVDVVATESLSDAAQTAVNIASGSTK